ncbi:GNAT family N-acetyltransferase [Nocardiopsis sp. N85]|uniref:GNAT family N-acetyltransferase n=1 Tax=Nocardiopsis sp. N85 TaxID=3029400 RepID=UPI00237F2AA6|nr:GNAT family N-acetyltransferase [Nocardiopsis sp. N85]MDE3724176.1 GNAT family N-acetyltransferase [Nocardiopsis sp. N85]
MNSSSLRAVEITPENVRAAIKVRVREDQNTFVAPVVHSLAEAYASRETAWPRLILDGDRPVAFVMADFDPDEDEPDHRCGIWRLNVAEGEQGKGYGGFAVETVLAEARRRGQKRVTVSWVPGEGSPEDFYLRLGFRKTGRVDEGEVVGEFLLD